MNKLTHTFLSILMIALLWNCESKKSANENDQPIEERTLIEMETDRGTMTIELYNETPKHRDNFVKLARSGEFDSLLFHRVIEKFMIQGGDPESRFAQAGDTLGNGGLGYKIDAEFRPQLFHKKVALGAARDGNPQRASSSMQFYIVQGKVFNDSLLDVAQGRINGWLREHNFKNDPENKEITDALQKAMENDDMVTYMRISETMSELAEDYQNYEKYTIPEEHREVYKRIGGTPHLDQNYTVFGEVVKGIEIIDSIAGVETDGMDRPVADVRILKVTVME